MTINLYTIIKNGTNVRKIVIYTYIYYTETLLSNFLQHMHFYREQEMDMQSPW